MPIISDEVLKNLDSIDQKSFDDEGIPKLTMDNSTIQNIFNLLLRGLVHPFTNFARSRNIVYPTIRDFFASAGIDDFSFQKIIVCSAENQRIFRDSIFRVATSAYDSENQSEMKARRDRDEDVYDFEIPTPDEFSDNTTEIPTKRNIYDRYYRKNNAPKTTEIPFEEYLESHENVEWWYNNGEKMRKYFAVPYHQLDEMAKSHRASFYPDYIVKFTDGTIGVFDTKSGRTAEDKHAMQKANALQGYLREHRCLGLWGGIVAPISDGWEIQADAVTREMARLSLSGASWTNEPNMGYSEKKFIPLTI